MSEPPLVSVITPVFNGARYVATAVCSVLAQSIRDWELLVVDDGSTDGTAAALRPFEPDARIAIISQPNAGVAAARNAAVRRARGEYLAFLDADDQWRPEYLATMLALAAQQPQAAAWHCGARCMDGEGHELPQMAGLPHAPSGEMYATLLRANFIIPSTLLVRRAAVVALGLFDPSLRTCEDWDLWLRLARAQPIVGTSECLVNYRLHGGSHSANVESMCRSAEAMVAKHFGPPDGPPQTWPPDKRRGYGGYYSYCALNWVTRQGDWQSGADYLRQALAADPTLADALDLFYEFALGAQPLGHRGTARDLDLARNAEQLRQALQCVPPLEAAVCRAAWGTACCALGLAAYHTQDLALARRFLGEALRLRPALWGERRLIATLGKSLLGRRLLGALRGLRAPA